MKLITKEIEDLSKKYGTQDDAEDPIVIAKFFNPTGARGTHYVLLRLTV